jgi:hypothetical protein
VITLVDGRSRLRAACATCGRRMHIELTSLIVDNDDDAG